MGGGNSTLALVGTLEHSKDENEKELAAEKLVAKVKQYSDQETYVKAVCKNAGQPLVTMLEKGTPKGKNHAAAVLSYLALNSENKVQLGKIGAITALAKLAKEGSPELQGAAAAALANLASRCPDNQAAIAKTGVISPLVGMLKSGLGEAKGWSASALGNVALQHRQNQQKVAEASAIPALVDLIQSQTPEPSAGPSNVDILSLLTCKRRASSSSSGSRNRQMAARALSSLAYNCPDNQAHMLKARCTETMLSLAKDGCREEEEEAFRVINLLWSKESDAAVRQRVLHADGLQIFLAVVQKSSSDESKASAAHMIARLAHEDANVRCTVAASGGIESLVQLAKTGVAQGRLNAVKALRELVHDCPDNARLIEKAGGSALLETFTGAMKFRELNEEEQAQFNQAQEKLDQMKAAKESNDGTPEDDSTRHPNKPLCFK